MKLILIVLGVILLVFAGVYFVVPADQLPTFLPGHETGMTRVHSKHGIVAAIVGVVLVARRDGGWDADEQGRCRDSRLPAVRSRLS
jgi:drug/metabolite transporter (DMT)-like permease